MSTYTHTPFPLFFSFFAFRRHFYAAMKLELRAIINNPPQCRAAAAPRAAAGRRGLSPSSASQACSYRYWRPSKRPQVDSRKPFREKTKTREKHVEIIIVFGRLFRIVDLNFAWPSCCLNRTLHYLTKPNLT